MKIILWNLCLKRATPHQSLRASFPSRGSLFIVILFLFSYLSHHPEHSQFVVILNWYSPSMCHPSSLWYIALLRNVICLLVCNPLATTWPSPLWQGAQWSPSLKVNWPKVKRSYPEVFGALSKFVIWRTAPMAKRPKSTKVQLVDVDGYKERWFCCLSVLLKL